MKNIIIGLSLLSPFFLNAQVRFNHQYDLEYQFNVLTSVLPTDSFIYATGVLTDTIDHPYWAGILFLKMNQEGEILTEKKLAPADIWYEPWRGDLIQDSDGNLFDIGYKWDSVQSVFLIKYTPEGDTLFTRTYFNPLFPDDDFIVSAALKEKTNGNMYLLCGIDNTLDGAEPDIYLMEIDHEGNLLHSYIYGDTDADEIPYSLLVDDDGGAIIGANKTNESITGHNFFSRTYIFKVDELGEIQWEYESHALDLFDIAYDMVKTPDGGIVIATGKGIEHQINSEDSQLRWSCYLLKLNTNHQKEWGIKLNDIEPTTSSGFTKVVEAPNGDGYTAMGILFEDVSYEEGLLGSCLFKVSPNGTNLWTRYYTYLDSIDINPKPYDLKTTPDGGYIIVGETKPQYPDGQQQRAWIMKLDEHGCLIPGCEENDSTILSTAGLPVGQPLQLAIHPNPTGSYLNFQLRHATAMPTASFRIVDAHGRTVSAIDSRMPWSTHVVPVHDWASGVYFLQYLENGQVRHSERFVVQ